MNLTLEEFDHIQVAHTNEQPLWYLFLNYGCPIENAEYAAKFNAVRVALENYANYLNEQQKLLGVEESISL